MLLPEKGNHSKQHRNQPQQRQRNNARQQRRQIERRQAAQMLVPNGTTAPSAEFPKSSPSSPSSSSARERLRRGRSSSSSSSRAGRFLRGRSSSSMSSEGRDFFLRGRSSSSSSSRLRTAMAVGPSIEPDVRWDEQLLSYGITSALAFGKRLNGGQSALSSSRSRTLNSSFHFCLPSRLMHHSSSVPTSVTLLCK